MKRILFFLCVFSCVSLSGQVPEFEWAVQMGGTQEDYGTSIATDTSGNVYVTGAFRDTADFDPSNGVYNLAAAGNERNTFVAKYDTNGELLWALALNSEFNEGYGICTDVSGNVYVTGRFSGTLDFDPSPNIYILSSAQIGDPFGSADIFTLKLDSNGSFIWAVNMGGADDGNGQSITVDELGNVYTTGYFRDTVDFDPGLATFYLAANGFGDGDIFISKLDSNGAFAWAKSMKGGSGFDRSISITLDNNNNVYTTGYFKSNFVDFDPGLDTFLLTSSGEADMFISKLNSDGDFIWAKRMGGFSAETHGFGINVDGTGSVYAIGDFQGSDVDFDPGPGTFNLSSENDKNIFISKLDHDGNFIWAKSIGSGGEDFGRAIAIDNYNNIYITGSFEDTIDFDPGTETYSLFSAGDRDVFILKLDVNGSFIWAGISASGNGRDHGYSVTLDKWDNIYTTGDFRTTVDVDPSENIYELSSYGDNDVFIHKLNQSCLTSLSINSPNTSFSICSGEAITLSTETSSSVEEVNYLWNTTDTSSMIVVSPDIDSIYTVLATYIENSYTCTVSDSVSIFVNQLSDTMYLNLTSCDTAAIGTVTFSLLDQSGCDSIVIETTTLQPLPETPVAPEDITIQENAPPFQTTIAAVPNATAYFWEVPVGAQILSGANTNSITIDWDDQVLSGFVCVSAINECGSSPADCMEVTVDIPDAVNELETKNHSIYPNPAADLLNVVLKDDSVYEILLLDVLGREVTSKKSFTGQTQIPLGNIPAGVYWIRLEAVDSKAEPIYVKVEVIR